MRGKKFGKTKQSRQDSSHSMGMGLPYLKGQIHGKRMSRHKRSK